MTWSSFAIIALALLVVYFLYRTLLVSPSAFSGAEPVGLESPHAVHVIAAVADASITEGNSVEVFTDGGNFYPAELKAIGQAATSINIEVYIFWAGKIADQFIDLLCERARAGVRVNLLVDGVGSAGLGIWRGRLRKLREAGCWVRFYHPFTPKLLDKVNIRTHREIMIIDGRIAFVGGAGVADHWMLPTRGQPWRDMMIRVEGTAVVALQGIFVENWLETSGEALIAERYFPECVQPGSTQVLVINSSTRGRSSHAQILHRLLLISAKRSITIVTPYFLPDVGVLSEIAEASRRGVEVQILTVGAHSDLPLVRAGGWRLYGGLLEAGVRIYEYVPGMFHVKMLLIDGLWAVIGTTNFDYRSFMINDEINLAIADAAFSERLAEDVKRDINSSRQLTLEGWKSRPFWKRLVEQLSRVIERQQ